MYLRTRTITIPAADAGANATVEIPVTAIGSGTVRILEMRVIAPALPSVPTTGAQRVFVGQESGGVLVDCFAVSEYASADNPQGKGIAYTRAAAELDPSATKTYYVAGSLENARGSEDVPLKVVYCNLTDVAQAGDVRIDLILAYED